MISLSDGIRESIKIAKTNAARAGVQERAALLGSKKPKYLRC